ncbi:MAG: transcriptional repressor AgaR [Psychromonas sp.]
MKNAIERRLEIYETIQRDGKKSVNELSDMFNVSYVTIRSDLRLLENNGHIIRSHGAAMPNVGLVTELNIKEKQTLNCENKRKIGKVAASLIHEYDSIIIDSGTTTKAIIPFIKHIENLTVMTNGLDIAVDLSSISGVEVLMPGGKLRKGALSFSGPQAEKSLKNYSFKKIFLGVDGFDLRSGITTHNEQEASLNRLLCDISAEVIALADSSKFNKHSCHMIRGFGDIDILISDSGIPPKYLKELRSTGVEVIIVD